MKQVTAWLWPQDGSLAQPLQRKTEPFKGGGNGAPTHRRAEPRPVRRNALEGNTQQSSPTENAAEALGSLQVWVLQAGPVSNTQKWETIQGDHRELQ